MTNFFLILMGFFMVSANIIGFLSYKKKKNLYFAAFIILLLAVLFGAIGGAIAVFMIRDAFAIFYGLQLGQYLIVDSVIVFFIAILVTLIKKFSLKNLIHDYIFNYRGASGKQDQYFYVAFDTKSVKKEHQNSMLSNLI
ncbi:hypothetical protein [Psychrobacillus sp. FSL K6-2843]|uniref:hypothetical protein n=1 Tax=Psychrobacillus sp. FSL K6-2843 TaxID=2921549 RepID=UPI003159B463